MLLTGRDSPERWRCQRELDDDGRRAIPSHIFSPTVGQARKGVTSTSSQPASASQPHFPPIRPAAVFVGKTEPALSVLQKDAVSEPLGCLCCSSFFRPLVIGRQTEEAILTPPRRRRTTQSATRPISSSFSGRRTSVRLGARTLRSQAPPPSRQRRAHKLFRCDHGTRAARRPAPRRAEAVRHRWWVMVAVDHADIS